MSYKFVLLQLNRNDKKEGLKMGCCLQFCAKHKHSSKLLDSRNFHIAHKNDIETIYFSALY
jgi:hypothetical protein